MEREDTIEFDTNRYEDFGSSYNATSEGLKAARQDNILALMEIVNCWLFAKPRLAGSSSTIGDWL